MGEQVNGFLVEDLSQEKNCPKCKQPYTKWRAAKTLNCGNKLCISCLKEIIIKDMKNDFICSFCNETEYFDKIMQDCSDSPSYQAYRQPYGKCEEHEEKTDMFCATHKSWVCGRCHYYNHKDCKVTRATNFKSSFNNGFMDNGYWPFDIRRVKIEPSDEIYEKIKELSLNLCNSINNVPGGSNSALDTFGNAFKRGKDPSKEVCNRRWDVMSIRLEFFLYKIKKLVEQNTDEKIKNVIVSFVIFLLIYC